MFNLNLYEGSLQFDSQINTNRVI